MRAFFGIWDFEGGPVDPFLLARASLLVRQFAGSKAAIVQRRSLALISETDTPDQKPAPAAPQDAPAAPALLWSGRLDNRAELAALSGARPDSLTDEQAIELAYARGGSDVFSRILGDWALAVVHEPERQLILGRDFAGVRSLFYRTHAATVVWSTHLAPLVLLEETIPALSEEYLAGWLSFFPEGHLTPYRDILAVPPASFVRITPNGTTSRKYWGLDSAKPLRYRTDRDYEEHFLSVFRESVARRLKSEAPLLAELSGGVDSSSIVCIADRLLAMGAVTSRLDTVTYFDSEEPTWDELPFAAKVEEQRGRIGHHIDVGPAQSVSRDEFAGGFSAVPGSIAERSPAAKAFDRIVSENGYAVVLSGLGGDELLGGVPTPVPELADLLARFRAIQFLRRSFRWALAKRKPILGLWHSVLAHFLSRGNRESSVLEHDWSWLAPDFRARNLSRLGAFPARFRFFGPLPSLQANAAAMEVLSRQISCTPASAEPGCEWRYPFLDRELVTFCSSIPREQLVRPHQRRSLMRRALAGIVPPEILERKRKAYVSRGLVKVLASEWRLLSNAPLKSADAGIVDAVSLSLCLGRAEQGHHMPVLPLLRSLALEQWLRGLEAPIVQPGHSSPRRPAEPPAPAAAQELLGRERPN